MPHIRFPLGIDGRGRTERASSEDHIRGMIEQFLFTEAGERVNRPDFGSGLRQLVFGPNSVEVAAALEHTVRAGLQRWLGDVVEVRRLEVEGQDAKLRVELEYSIRSTGALNRATFERERSP